MNKGEKLVRKCSKIRWWNYCFKVHYTIKLCKLDEDIARFGQVDLQMRKTTLVQMLCPDDKIEVQNESNFPVKVHPLPLSPGAATPSPFAPAPQPIAESESLWMNSQWQKGRLIGRSSFGSVYLATNRETGALCAMKEIELFPDDPKSAECTKQLQQVDDRFFIYLEYVHPGSINKYVREHFGTIPESVVRNFTRHILFGLVYLHSTKTIHRDIRGANLLVDSSGVVKLADFGMAKHLTEQAADLSLKGSPCWMAPEIFEVWVVLLLKCSLEKLPGVGMKRLQPFSRYCITPLPYLKHCHLRARTFCSAAFRDFLRRGHQLQCY